MNNTTYTAPNERDLNEMNRKISELKGRAHFSSTEARDAFDKQMKAVEDQYRLVTAKMQKFSKQTDSASDEIKKGIYKAWNDLEEAFKDASRVLH